jgi:hypothetical protein
LPIYVEYNDYVALKAGFRSLPAVCFAQGVPWWVITAVMGGLKRRYGKNFETLIPIHSFPL